MSDIEELERLAKAATPGPWATNFTYYRVESEKEHGWINDGWAIAEFHGTDKEANHLFVAAANPAAVLELIAKIKELQSKLDAVMEPLTNDCAKKLITDYYGTQQVSKPVYIEFVQFVHSAIRARAGL